MFTTKLRKVGGSVMLAVPPAMLDTLGLAAEKLVSLEPVDGGLMLKPGKPRYALHDLLAQCDPAAPFTDEDRIWLDSGPVGRERI